MDALSDSLNSWDTVMTGSQEKVSPEHTFQLSRIAAAGHEDSLATCAPLTKAQLPYHCLLWSSAQVKLDQAHSALQASAILHHYCVCIPGFPACMRPHKLQSAFYARPAKGFY